jgi:predicted Zn finger-like uncharacterized protein
MLTCCPQCGTTFRVSPQQLKVHQGEVRCGRCATVFDAFDSLLAEASETSATVVESLGGQPVVAPLGAPAEAPSEQAAPEERRRELRELLPAADMIGVAPSPAPSAAFAGQGRAGPRWPWVVLSAVAALGLASQATYRYRAELAAMWPDTRPWLDRACVSLHCAVPLPRHIELVSIDASDLQVDTTHANLMLLTATLKNRAPFAQEHPALALTLTDVSEQPLARRVLNPADYLERKTDTRVGFAANGEFAIKVFIDSRDLKATGYRLFLFYP